MRELGHRTLAATRSTKFRAAHAHRSGWRSDPHGDDDLASAPAESNSESVKRQEWIGKKRTAADPHPRGVGIARRVRHMETYVEIIVGTAR